MNDNQNSYPIVSIIFSIVGFLIIGFSSSIMTTQRTLGLIACIIGFLVGLYCVFKVESKKACTIISIIICIITFIMYSL